jgi:hypothetical protein
MEDEKNNNKESKKLTRTDLLLIAIFLVSIADFITRIIKG